MPVLPKVRRGVVGPVIAAVIAVTCTAILYVMYFGPDSDVQGGRINMISQAAVDRAGATALPTGPSSGQPVETTR